jgi:release factor glutamine methyltransferase
VPYSRVYEPAEDSFLLLDTLSSTAEGSFLQTRFPPASPTPLVLEIGTGSGIVLAFINAHAGGIFGHERILTCGIDMNAFACRSTVETVRKAADANPLTHGMYLGSSMGDLASCVRKNEVDVLVFNPPYVPTPDMPVRPAAFEDDVEEPTWDDESYLLSLSYAGGRDGMETTDRLIDLLPGVLSGRGVAYLLLCRQNRPDEVVRRIEAWGGWRAEVVGSSGRTAGWEKLCVLRIWRAG